MNMAAKLSVGINGAGRFGLHLLQYWIDHQDSALFAINYINDSLLTSENIATIIQGDKYLRLRDYVSLDNNCLVVRLPTKIHRIELTQSELHEIAWLGKPDIFLECSGKHTKDTELSNVNIGNTLKTIISATSWTADEILVVGHNHTAHKNTPVVSYGSCTVNAYIPLAHMIDARFGVIDSDVNIIHNVPVHQLENFQTIERRECTLALVAPRLLNFINEDNFSVNYSLVPYDGVSVMDFRFRLRDKVDRQHVVSTVQKEINEGYLKELYDLTPSDTGPEPHKFTKASAVLIESSIILKGDNLYFQAYFDNENSVNRYYDLINYFCLEESR